MGLGAGTRCEPVGTTTTIERYAAGTAPGVARLHYRLPARDWRGTAHPSTQSAAARLPPPAPSHRFIHSVHNYSYGQHDGDGREDPRASPPRERAARARVPRPASRHAPSTPTERPLQQSVHPLLQLPRAQQTLHKITISISLKLL